MADSYGYIGLPVCRHSIIIVRALDVVPAVTEHRGRVINTPDSHSEGPGLKNLGPETGYHG
jgi:hypothetical protein